MLKHSAYTDLFRQAAIKHKLILHTEAKPAFARLILSADPYLPVHEQIDEFLSNNRNKLKTPLMLITSYEAGYRNQRGGDIDKQLSGRMIILEQVRKDKFQGEEEALELTEKIGEQCMAFIENQSEQAANVPLFFFDWGGVQTERLSKLTDRNLFGTAFNFTIQSGTEDTIYNPENFLP